MDYIKDKKERLQLNVYQKNARAISFYQREGFIIEGEGLDEATGEKEYTMLWKQNRNRNFYKELIQKAGAETELVYMKASKELLKKRLYKRNQVLNANSPFVITDEIGTSLSRISGAMRRRRKSNFAERGYYAVFKGRK